MNSPKQNASLYFLNRFYTDFFRIVSWCIFSTAMVELTDAFPVVSVILCLCYFPVRNLFVFMLSLSGKIKISYSFLFSLKHTVRGKLASNILWKKMHGMSCEFCGNRKLNMQRRNYIWGHMVWSIWANGKNAWTLMLCEFREIIILKCEGLPPTVFCVRNMWMNDPKAFHCFWEPQKFIPAGDFKPNPWEFNFLRGCKHITWYFEKCFGCFL